MYRNHLKRAKRHYFPPRKLRLRVAFWGGALLIGIIADGGTPSLTFPFLKMLTTIASYLSGIPGGIFAPSLSVGAGLDSNLALLMPDSPAPALGMVGYFSGVVQTYLSKTGGE